MKIIQMTDAHFVLPGQTLYGKNPKAHLEMAVEQINRQHGDAEMVVITGDLAHLGQKEAYTDLGAVLDRLQVPYHLVIGNHDNREVLGACFPALLRDENGFVQYVVETRAGVFIMLDTKQDGTHEGTFCRDRLHWLSRQLETYPDIPKYIFMHHAPFMTYLPSIDVIGLSHSNRLGVLLQEYSHIRHIFCGHAHRPMAGSWYGIPVSCLRGMNHQVVLDFQTGEGQIPLCFEAPQYCVCFLAEDSVVVHHHDFYGKSSLFTMDDFQATVDKKEMIH